MSERNPTLDPNIVAQALRDGELHKALLDQLEEGIYMVDRERRILYWNAAAEQITGYLAHEVAGHFCHGNLMMHCDASGAVLCGKACPLSATMLDGKPRECTVFLRHRHGYRLPVHVRARPIYDSAGVLVGAVEVFEEAAAARREKIHSLEAFDCLDELTGAARREYGEMKFSHELEGLNRFGVPLGWLRVQMDRLQEFEHRYGHGMIDTAAKLIAGTVDANVGLLDVLTYWDRADFRLAVHNCTRQTLAELAQKLVTLVNASNLQWWGDPVRITVSIAGELAERGDSIESLEARTAEAFARCRANGGNQAAILHRGAAPAPERLGCE